MTQNQGQEKANTAYQAGGWFVIDGSPGQKCRAGNFMKSSLPPKMLSKFSTTSSTPYLHAAIQQQ
jgi:hypothetical protein